MPNTADIIFRGTKPPPQTDVWERPLTTQVPATAIPRSAQIPPFWQFKPPGGIDLSINMRGTLAAVAGATLRLTPNPVSSWTVLSSFKAVLAQMRMITIAPLATTDITYTLLNNGGPVPGWDRFQPPQVAVNAFVDPVNGPLQLPQKSFLEVLVTNNAATGPWNVEVSLVGWMWPKILEQRTFGVIDED